MPRKNGGMAGGKVSVSGASASGIWDMIDQQQNKSIWPSTTIPATIEYLIQAGGGAGGFFNGSGANANAGGGGAGGLLQGSISPVGGVAYDITIGAGGPYGSNTPVNGSNSVFNSLNAIGGGRGGGTSPLLAAIGGCGGGGAGSAGPITPAAGTAGQGTAGSTGGTGDNGWNGGGGGGTSTTTGNKNGGAGTVVTIAGTDPQVPSYLRTYGGGGGGGVWSDYQRGDPGAGGGGAGGGGYPFTNNGTSGDVNTGGGGGGHRYDSPARTSGSGGSGIVIIAFPDSKDTPTISIGLTYTINTTSRPGFKVIKFTAGTGTMTWS